MVKNTTGGSKTKGQARKFVTAKPSNVLRISQDDCECYAQVVKMLGNGMCHVLCIDGETRLCHIRGKFRGRGKRDNFINNGTWILAGLREWEIGKETSKEGSKEKLQNCDLLEVYTELDKERLKNTITNINWSMFVSNDNKLSNLTEKDETIEFTDDRMEEYRQLVEAQVTGSGASRSITIITEDEEINVDDI